jgi:nitrite reductase/ring-hydroxylating ferredoxin subunit
MGFFKRLFGICNTGAPRDPECWTVDGKRIVIQRSRAPELGEIGGAIRLEGKGLQTRLLVLHGVDDAMHAYVNRCTCSGWRLDPVASEAKVRCSTLGASTYDYSGKCVSGAKNPDLPTCPVEANADTLVITLS